ncbi:MAG: metal-sensitive transcriptional regulator [Chloroflexi bacterium]|nr:metal-sensitive transcriptional regulator [Chloroflexota bacterium]
MEREEFLRRVHYLRGHLEAVVRMVEEGRDCGEVVRQMRAVRRAAEKLEVQCLLAYLAAENGERPPRLVQGVLELYRLSHR